MRYREVEARAKAFNEDLYRAMMKAKENHERYGWLADCYPVVDFPLETIRLHRALLWAHKIQTKRAHRRRGKRTDLGPQ